MPQRPWGSPSDAFPAVLKVEQCNVIPVSISAPAIHMADGKIGENGKGGTITHERGDTWVTKEAGRLKVLSNLGQLVVNTLVKPGDEELSI